MALQGQALAGETEAPAAKSWVSVVEIAPLTPAPLNRGRPERAHHGLRLGGESQTQALRSWGLPVSDCATQLRVPTKLRQTANGLNADVRAELRFGCRF